MKDSPKMKTYDKYEKDNRDQLSSLYLSMAEDTDYDDLCHEMYEKYCKIFSRMIDTRNNGK